MTTADEQLNAIRDVVARYAHVSGTRVLPLPEVVAKLVDDWATLVERQIQEDEQNAQANKDEEDFDAFFKTHTPEEIDARLQEDGIDPVDVRRWASEFKRFIPMVFRAKERADAAEAKLAALTPSAEHEKRAREEGYRAAEAELQPLIWHPLRDRECRSCDGTGWILFNNHCDCVDAAYKKLRAEGAAEAEEKYAKLKKEHDRVTDILFHAITGETTPHDEEMPKDFASMAAATIREYGSRMGAMNDRIELDPHYRSRVAAYDKLIERIPEWKQRWLPTQHASNAVAREAKLVLPWITAARAAGFPLGKVEDLVMKLIDEEKKAEKKE